MEGWEHHARVCVRGGGCVWGGHHTHVWGRAMGVGHHARGGGGRFVWGIMLREGGKGHQGEHQGGGEVWRGVGG